MPNSPCVQDHGLYSEIPDSGVSIKTFAEAYDRLGGDLDVLQKGFYLESWQLYAAMAFYCANKEMFDAETARFRERQRNLSNYAMSPEQVRELLATFPPSTGREATDEEMDADLERLS